MIKCVVFDVGNVLWFYEPFHQDLFQAWGKLVGQTGEELYAEFEQVYQEFQKDESGYQVWLNNLNGDVDSTYADELLKGLINKHFRHYLNEDLLEMIPQLKSQHIIVGCLSNTENYMAKFHQMLNREVRFDFQILSYAVEARKPEEEIYQQVFNYVDFAPSEVLFIDDKQENIDGAKEIGLVTHHYQSLDRVFERLAEIGN
jgi:putative hydrolase of the HAD superfamily